MHPCWIKAFISLKNIYRHQTFELYCIKHGQRHSHPYSKTNHFWKRLNISWVPLKVLLMHHEVQHVWSAEGKNKTSERNSVSWLKRWTRQSFWCGLLKQTAKLQEDDAFHNVRPVSGERLLSGDKNAHVHLFIIKRARLYLYPIRVTPPHTHAHARSWGSGLLSITWPWDKHNLGLWHQSRPLLDHTSPIHHMCSHHKNIMRRWPTAAEDFKSFKQLLNLCLELDKYVLKIMNDISMNT